LLRFLLGAKQDSLLRRCLSLIKLLAISASRRRSADLGGYVWSGLPE
jgi:hypothetical protein